MHSSRKAPILLLTAEDWGSLSLLGEIGITTFALDIFGLVTGFPILKVVQVGHLVLLVGKIRHSFGLFCPGVP